MERQRGEEAVVFSLRLKLAFEPFCPRTRTRMSATLEVGLSSGGLTEV